MKDYLVIGTDKNKHFRAYAAITTELVKEARERHNTSPTASAALGRGLTAGVLMSANLKGDDLLTLRIMGNGPLGTVVVTADSAGLVRGYVQNPEADPPSKNDKLDVGSAVGSEGRLSVTKNMGLKDPYTGSVPLISGEIGEDLAYYYAKSEQIPTVVALGVLLDTNTSVISAGGYLIQALPGAEDHELSALEQRAVSLPNISKLYSEQNPPEMVLKLLLGDDFVELQRRPVGFLCGCTREKLEKILISLGEREIQDIIEGQKEAELTCHFCGDRYLFEKQALLNVLKEAKE